MNINFLFLSTNFNNLFIFFWRFLKYLYHFLLLFNILISILVSMYADVSQLLPTRYACFLLTLLAFVDFIFSCDK